MKHISQRIVDVFLASSRRPGQTSTKEWVFSERKHLEISQNDQLAEIEAEIGWDRPSSRSNHLNILKTIKNWECGCNLSKREEHKTIGFLPEFLNPRSSGLTCMLVAVQTISDGVIMVVQTKMSLHITAQGETRTEEV